MTTQRTTPSGFPRLTTAPAAAVWIPVVIGQVWTRAFVRPAVDASAPNSRLPDGVAGSAEHPTAVTPRGAAIGRRAHLADALTHSGGRSRLKVRAVGLSVSRAAFVTVAID